MLGTTISTMENAGLSGGINGILSKRPYIATAGRNAGHPCITVHTGQTDQSGNPVYAEKQITTNATLRKDEWIDLEGEIIEAARERLVIVDDLIQGGLTYNVGGLGTIISEWETMSEMTDAKITMDGESVDEKDQQAFGLNGVPIPVIGKSFSIGERMLLASRQRGAALDTTQGVEAARAVARVSENMVFNGANIGASNSSGQRYTIPGLLNSPGRGTDTINDWADSGTTAQDILDDVLSMIKVAETQERHYGPFTLYIPGVWAYRLREDFKANSDKTLEQRILEISVISRIRVADALPAKNVLLIQMEKQVLDLAIASDITTVQWQSGSGWTNHFQTFAAWAPRFKQDYDGHSGIVHGSLT